MNPDYPTFDEQEEYREEEAAINSFREGCDYWDNKAQLTGNTFAHNRALWYADSVVDLLDIPFYYPYASKVEDGSFVD
jgi:hypothetical protein